MAVLVSSSREDAAAYVDPVMVLVTCVLFLAAPLRMVRTTILELLEGEPDAEIRAPVHEAVDAVAERYGIADPVVRTTKVGPKLYVEIEALVEPDVTVAQQHQVREELNALLDELPFDLWLNVELLPRPTPSDAPPTN
jgi:predicted Co/Zn/Cd cation transporter (cation efflux family)